MSHIPIADFRIESAGRSSFDVFVRRQRGTTAVVIVLKTVFPLLCLIPFFYHPSPRSAQTATALHSPGRAAHSSGTPLCFLPFLVIVAATFVVQMRRSEKTYLRGFRGKERWSFAPTRLDLPSDETGTELPALLAGAGHIRARVDLIGGKSVIEFFTNGRSIYLGPFRTGAIAGRCEAELRQHFPHWFTDPTGTVLLNAVPDGFRAVYGQPIEPIISVKPIAIGSYDFRLQLCRQQGPRPPATFFAVWICFWLVSMVFLVRMILASIVGGSTFKGPRLDGSLPPALFFSIFAPLWTAAGSFIIWYFVMCLRRVETWRFSADAIVSGRNFQHISTRRLSIDQTVQVRFGPFADPPSVDFISRGNLLHMGPFATWDLAGEAMGDLERQFPHWQWPRVPLEG